MKNIFKSIGWLVLNVFLQFVVGTAYTAIFIASTGTKDDSVINEYVNNNVFMVTCISNLLFVLIASIICKAKKLKIKEEWKANKVSAKEYIFPCIIAFAYSFCYAMLTYNPVANSTAMTHKGVEYYGSFGIPMMILTLLISAPVTEEIMCRGIMMNTLKRSFSSRTAIILSAVIFGAMHIMAGGFALAIGGIIMGLIFGVVYEKTNSIYVAIAAHIIANVPDFILYSSPQITDGLRYTLAAVSLIICVACAVVWFKRCNAERKVG